MKKKTKRIITILLIAIGIILFWRGVWALADLYLLPKYASLSAVVSIIIGFLILYYIHKGARLKELY